MEDANKAELEKIRRKIDAIDNQFLELLKQRIDHAQEIGRIKSKDKRAKYDPLRERQIYDRLLKNNKGEFPNSRNRRCAPYSMRLSPPAGCRRRNRLFPISVRRPPSLI